VRSIINITAIGLLFGIVAKWRKSLVPGMLAHAATDIAGVF
jgi:membrane protease YdiL (CAAX protease family)